MAAPVFAPISSGDPFSSLVVRDNFDRLRNAINADVNPNNIAQVHGGGALAVHWKTRVLDFSSFHKGAVSDVFSNSSTDTASFMYFPKGPKMYGDAENEYDVDDCALRFYLHEDADLIMSANVQITKAMHNWTTLNTDRLDGGTPSDALYEMATAPLSVQATAQWFFDDTGLDIQQGFKKATVKHLVQEDGNAGDTSYRDRRGFSLSLSGTKTAVNAGAHTVRVRLSFDTSAGTEWAPSTPFVSSGAASQFISNFRNITVLAVYKPKFERF